SVLGPEMRSTGEVMGIDRDFPTAFAKGLLGASVKLPRTGTVFVSVADRDKRAVVLPVKELGDMGFGVVATTGTAAVLSRDGIPTSHVHMHFEADAEDRTVLDYLSAGTIDMVINVPSGRQERADGYEIRAAATANSVPLITTLAEFAAAVTSLEVVRDSTFDVRSLQDWSA